MNIGAFCSCQINENFVKQVCHVGYVLALNLYVMWLGNLLPCFAARVTPWDV